MPGAETKTQEQADFDPQGGAGPGMAAQCKRDTQAIYFVQIPGLLFVTQELKQLWVKNRLRASLFKNTPYFYPRLDFRESTLASKEEQTLEMFSLVVFGRF